MIVIFGLTTSCLQANTNMFTDRDKEHNQYQWRPLSDENQYHQAIGMTIWGFSMAVFTILVALLIPDSPAPKSTSGSAQSGGQLFTPTAPDGSTVSS